MGGEKVFDILQPCLGGLELQQDKEGGEKVFGILQPRLSGLELQWEKAGIILVKMAGTILVGFFCGSLLCSALCPSKMGESGGRSTGQGEEGLRGGSGE